MVQLQEIIDEHFQEGQQGPEEDDADYTDTGTLLLVGFADDPIYIFMSFCICLTRPCKSSVQVANAVCLS
jgi:hypothetical protein